MQDNASYSSKLYAVQPFFRAHRDVTRPEIIRAKNATTAKQMYRNKWEETARVESGHQHGEFRVQAIETTKEEVELLTAVEQENLNDRFDK